MKTSNISRNQFQHRGLNFSYLDSTPDCSSRQVVLLIHGFPDSAAMWTHQIESVHDAGYRCIAPDNVGCGESEIAAYRRDYHAQIIMEDHRALLDHLQVRKAHVVGHDWGAVLGWLLAGWHPTRVHSLMVLSVGHPMAFARSGIDQKLASWYIVFFLLAGLAERLLIGNGRFSLRRLCSSHPEINEVMTRMSKPGRLTAALRIYRASTIAMIFRRHPRVALPTLGIWSRGDVYLVESQMRNSARYMDGPWVCEVIDGGHWISLEQPEFLNSRLLAHLDSCHKYISPSGSF